jgi:endonuclease/exonuclease/phosphatase family metal-dependent hydrolase
MTRTLIIYVHFVLMYLAGGCIGTAVAQELLTGITPRWLMPFDGFNDRQRGREAFRIMFYNCENLFDPLDDTTTADDDFTPEGSKQWSYYRFKKKISDISKVILAAGGWEPPDLIGLCEVENRWVLEQLTGSPALSGFDYDIIHQDGNDPRGIDVAILYRTSKFEPNNVRWVPMVFAGDPHPRTRDILYVSGIANGAGTLHLFVNHWPSRLGGYAATMPKRMQAARLLRQMIDSVGAAEKNTAIVVMGDLNDETEQESISIGLGALPGIDPGRKDYLFDATYHYNKREAYGTHKNRGTWGMLDHFIISSSLLDESARLHLAPGGAKIYRAGFLLTPDERNLGV